jgi:hypothetical protein
MNVSGAMERAAHSVGMRVAQPRHIRQRQSIKIDPAQNLMLALGAPSFQFMTQFKGSKEIVIILGSGSLFNVLLECFYRSPDP